MRRFGLASVIGVAALLLLSAAPGHATTPGRTMEYAPGRLLDLYLPPPSARPAPVVIWSHGSGWMADNGRDGAEVVAAHFNRRGYAVAGLAVRSSSQARFPGQLDDLRAAIQFLKGQAGLDPDRIGIMGESSGGWLAAMGAVTGQVRAAVAFYPPTDFLRMDEFMLDGCAPFNRSLGLTGCHADPRSPESLLLGCPIEQCPDKVAEANPITYASSTSAPLLIIHGQRDILVPWQQGEMLFHAVRGTGGDATLVLLPHGEHGQWNDYLNGSEASWDYVLDFFDSRT
ncbi:alpha/beta hydrolase [Actinoplanes sp. Pm04-4]|uniref:Alpha/beta hydrolase n=1 Tax=Paractinoplanes pyxinae TaxID=2997416 RepID=A0ABT4ATJ5_9ACTN|nr:alpha/beta hydrolase [Actinoplanes pyxinae]MCY1137142.1 alpha/beta hydrolase [Actinoplanes pyxinae]